VRTQPSGARKHSADGAAFHGAAGQNQPMGSVRRRPLEFHAWHPGATARRVSSSSPAPRGRPLLDPTPLAQVPPEKQLREGKTREPLASTRRSPPEAAPRRDMSIAGRSRELRSEGPWADRQAAQGSTSKTSASPHAGAATASYPLRVCRSVPVALAHVSSPRSRQRLIRLIVLLRSDARPLGGGPAFPWVGEGLHGDIGAWRREGAR
jgi:hypothetical protein